MHNKLSIQQNLALTITMDRLQGDQNLAERSYLSVDNILKLSDFVLNHNYFRYERYLDVPWVPPLVLF